jgi:hypothetical protein
LTDPNEALLHFDLDETEIQKTFNLLIKGVKQRGEKELGKNLETCNTLLKHEPKAKLKLLPVINENEMDIKEKFYPKEYVKKFGGKMPIACTVRK